MQEYFSDDRDYPTEQEILLNAVLRDLWIFIFGGRKEIHRIFQDRKTVFAFRLPKIEQMNDFTEFDEMSVRVKIPSREFMIDETGMHPAKFLEIHLPLPALSS